MICNFWFWHLCKGNLETDPWMLLLLPYRAAIEGLEPFPEPRNYLDKSQDVGWSLDSPHSTGMVVIFVANITDFTAVDGQSNPRRFRQFSSFLGVYH